MRTMIYMMPFLGLVGQMFAIAISGAFDRATRRFVLFMFAWLVYAVLTLAWFAERQALHAAVTGVLALEAMIVAPLVAFVFWYKVR